ncbi:hypothetical protein BV22DRAFT_1135832 [Leucogyrophana mollusca]|uniref:Uncharacterized protein n=1 Tax=Leucogyrophana mollusca TaxID=85980 RepID=A0ACB8AX17_9AGAM|nr:hypothetical protein BV22DRAFT_1135832 [Leucogyrophana mollusca]
MISAHPDPSVTLRTNHLGCSQNLTYTPSNPKRLKRIPGIPIDPQTSTCVPIKPQVSGISLKRLERIPGVPIEP